MKASKFSEAQIAFVLKQAEDGTAIGEVCYHLARALNNHFAMRLSDLCNMVDAQTDSVRSRCRSLGRFGGHHPNMGSN